MKKIPALLFATFFSTLIFSQLNESKPQPPYKKLGVLPALGLLHFDSATITTLNTLPKDLPVLVVCFSTTCDHCQAEAIDLVKNKEKMKKVRIVMVTPEKLVHIKAFYDKYNLSELKNLVIGKDYRFFAPTFYTFRNFPFSVFYNKDHQYIFSIEGTATSKMILDEFKKHKAIK
jgi:thiol-disulfide isomerase/thioredoxin